MSRSWLASVKPAPRLIKRPQHTQPFLGLQGQFLAGFGREIGIGARFRPADAAPDLVKLRQPEHIGAMDDHRVGGRDIQPGFHDGRRQQHVEFAVIEGVHPVVQLARRHLAVGDDVGHFGHLSFQPVLHLGQIADAGHDEERLPAAVMFAQQAPRAG